MLEALKGGYKKSGFVARVEDVDNKKQPQRFKTYCFKMLAAEHSLSGKGAKGADERFFKIKSKRALPKRYIAEVLGLIDIGKKSEELERISNLRRLMLLYKLKHFNDDFRDVEINVIDRDKELTHSLISLFYGSQALKDVIKSLDIFLREKKERKMQTLEAEFFNIVHGFIENPNSILDNLPEELHLEDKKRLTTIFAERLQKDLLQAKLDDIVEVPYAAIIQKFMEDTGSAYKYGEDKKSTITNDEYGDISMVSISDMLRDRFGGKHGKHKRYHYYEFSKSYVSGLVEGYKVLEPLQIIEEKVEDCYGRSGDRVTG
jgi:hypothetical protein